MLLVSKSLSSTNFAGVLLVHMISSRYYTPMSKPRYRIDVRVHTRYVAEQSNADSRRYAFAYTVSLRNEGSVGARLMTRHWRITDADGKVREVRGEGVVGEQPWLAPGESFEYTSGTELQTSVGTMQGSYQMLADDGTLFEAPIDPFTLSVPRTLH